MRRNAFLFATTILVSTAPAFAADQLKFGKAPAWVIPQTIPPEVPSAKDAPVALLLHDQQTSLEPGKTRNFSQIAIKFQTAEGLRAGNVTVGWNPATDTTTVNKLEIRRGDKVIDVLAGGQTFTTMRRETNLDSATLDGMLTATLQPEDLQVGDVIVLATTIEHVDPVMKSHVETSFAEWNGTTIGFGHARLLWPSDLKLNVRQSQGLPPSSPSKQHGQSVIEISQANVEPMIAPSGAPARFRIGRLGDATDFRSWSDVADLMAPLFRTAAAVPASGPLRDEVEKIRKASADPKARAQMALDLAQNRVRYVALLMGQGGYVPASAETTWSRRFGDCKAKTALLLAILHELGISADPVMVNASMGDAIAERLPMVGVFNHVLVRANIAGKTYWLDGTRNGDSNLDRIQVPDFGWGLPIVANAQLVHIVPAPLDKPNTDVAVDVDVSGGIFASGPVTIAETFRGDTAVMLNQIYSQLSAAQRDEYLRAKAKDYFDSMEMKTSSIQFDKESQELRIAINGEAKLDWHDGWHSVYFSSIGYDPDFDRPAGPLHDAPFEISYPQFSKRRITFHFPPGFPLDEQKLPGPVAQAIAGMEYNRSIATEGNLLRIDSSSRSVVPEIAYKDAVAAKARLKALNQDDVHFQMPANYAPTVADLAALDSETPADAVEYFLRGHARLKHNQVDQAIADLTAGLALDPKNVWALAKRAEAYTGKRQLTEAEKDLRAAEAIDPGNPAIMAASAQAAIAKGDIATAVATYDKALERSPGSQWLRFGRATTLLRLGKMDDALRDLATIIAAEPRNVSALTLRAQLLGARRDWAAADKDLAAASAADPGNPSILAAKATVALVRKDYKSALDLASQSLDRDPTNEQARSVRAQVLQRDGKQTEALRVYDEAVARQPRDTNALLNRADARLRAKEFDAAQKDVAAALAISPSDPRALHVQSSIAMARGNFAAAIETLTALLKVAPADGPALAERAEAYRQLRQYDAALADTEAAIKIGFVPPELRLKRINIFAAQRNLTAKAAEVERMVSENPTSDFAMVAAGKTYSAMGMRQKAMESFDRALALKPYTYIYLNRSQARAPADLQGKMDDLDAALKLEPDDEDILAEKARILSRQGENAQAIDLYDRAIKTASNPSGLQLGRAIALQRAGRSAEATKVFDAERAKAKTAGDFNNLCWTKAINDVVLESALQDCREALRLDPENSAARDSLGMVLLKLGKLAEARTAYDRAIAKNGGAGSYMGRAIVRARMGDIPGATADAAEARKSWPTVDDGFAEYGLKLDIPQTVAANKQ